MRPHVEPQLDPGISASFKFSNLNDVTIRVGAVHMLAREYPQSGLASDDRREVIRELL